MEHRPPPAPAQIRPEWLARTPETALEPELPIVDAHHHLWDMPGHRYLLPELLEDVGGGHAIAATVFVECKAMYRVHGDSDFFPVGEVEFANGIAAMSASGGYGDTRVCSGIVGNAQLQLGDRVAAVLEAEVAASGGRLRGIRNASVWHADPAARGSAANPPPHLLQGAAFRAGFARLAPLGLAFDAFLYHTQLDELADLAGAFEGTTIVLDHVGCPLGIGPYAGRRETTFGQWRASMQNLARHPNVVVKLGGFGMRMLGFDFHEREVPPSSADVAAACGPYVEACIEAFGPSRCMFESNFPVDKAAMSYTVLWNAFKRLTTGYSQDERADLFHRVATRTYGLAA